MLNDVPKGVLSSVALYVSKFIEISRRVFLYVCTCMYICIHMSDIYLVPFQGCGEFIINCTYLIFISCTDSPNKPHNITLTPGVNSINASWEHDRSCFESHVFKYIIICKEVGSRDSSENVIMNGTTFNIPGLKPGTYNICVLAVSTSDEQVKSKPECKTTSGKTYVSTLYHRVFV